MIATSYTLENGVYTFVFQDGMKSLIPESAVILIDDGSDLISVKAIANRKTIFLANKQ